MNVNFALFILGLFGCVANARIVSQDSNDCYSSRDQVARQNFLSRFSTITPYDAVRGSAFNPSSCEPKKIAVMLRHGSRRPSSSEGDMLMKNTSRIPGEIIKNIDAGRTLLCDGDANLIRQWQLDMIMLNPDSGLTVYGKQEMMNIAHRLQQTYPTLFPEIYSSSITFRHSPSTRTLDSAKAYAEQLFGHSEHVNYTNSGSNPDMLLQSFEQCSTWKYLLQPLALVNADAFKRSVEFERLVANVNNKLGFGDGSQLLIVNEIQSILIHCMYEQILAPTKLSPFCAALPSADLPISEYYLDLLQNYLSGYGFNKNYKNLYRNMNCELVKNILDFLNDTGATETTRLFFGHDTTMQFLFVAMGLFEDAVPMTANNFAQQSNRKWRTSLNTPTAANLAFVHLKCPDGEEDEILLQHNERPLQLPGCDQNGICKRSVFLQRLSYFANANCSRLFCTNNTS